jgi:hypothetical protein
MLEIIPRLTKIPKDALDGTREVSTYSIAQRMSWPAGKNTTRVEDVACCFVRTIRCQRASSLWRKRDGILQVTGRDFEPTPRFEPFLLGIP